MSAIELLKQTKKWVKTENKQKYSEFRFFLNQFYLNEIKFSVFLDKIEKYLQSNKLLHKKLTEFQEKMQNQDKNKTFLSYFQDFLNEIENRTENQNSFYMLSATRLLSLLFSDLITSNFFLEQISIIFSSLGDEAKQQILEKSKVLTNIQPRILLNFIICSSKTPFALLLLWDPLKEVPNCIKFYAMLSHITSSEEIIASTLKCIWMCANDIISFDVLSGWLTKLFPPILQLLLQFFNDSDSLSQLLPCNTSKYMDHCLVNKKKLIFRESIINFIESNQFENQTTNILSHFSYYFNDVSVNDNLIYPTEEHVFFESEARKYFKIWSILFHYIRTNEVLPTTEQLPTIVEYFIGKGVNEVAIIDDNLIKYCMETAFKNAQKYDSAIFSKYFSMFREQKSISSVYTMRIAFSNFLREKSILRHIVLSKVTSLDMKPPIFYKIIQEFKKPFQQLKIWDSFVNAYNKVFGQYKPGQNVVVKHLNENIVLFVFYVYIFLTSIAESKNDINEVIQNILTVQEVPYKNLDGVCSNIDLIIQKLAKAASKYQNQQSIGDIDYTIHVNDSSITIKATPNLFVFQQ